MDKTAMILTPRIERSEFSDGRQVYIATFDEMPGIVCEGESEAAAFAELLASMNHLRKNAGLHAIGLNTEVASRWRWQAYQGTREFLSFGTETEVANATVDLPPEFRELQPMG